VTRSIVFPSPVYSTYASQFSITQLAINVFNLRIHSCQYSHIESIATGYKCVLFDYIVLYIY
jgi:hypothetical protein